MSVYHFEKGELVKIFDDFWEALDEDREGNPDEAMARAGFNIREEIQGAYIGYVADGRRPLDHFLNGYGYAFTIETIGAALPWTLLVRDDLPEYLAAVKLLEPLFTRLTYHSVDGEVMRRIEAEVQSELKARRVGE